VWGKVYEEAKGCRCVAVWVAAGVGVGCVEDVVGQIAEAEAVRLSL
jgi:hypothetical protein